MHRIPLVRWLRDRVFARVGKNAVALLIAQVGARLLNLVLMGRVARALGVDGLGRYLLAMTVQAVVLALVDLGLNTFVLREFSRLGERVSRSAWGMVLGLKLLAALGGIVILNGLVAPLFSPSSRQLLMIASFSLFPGSFNGVATALIKARRRMEVSGAVNLGVVLVYTFVGLLVIGCGYDERALLAAYGLTSVSGSAVFALLLRRWRIPIRLARPGPGWREILGQSLPFAVTGIFTMLYARLDLLLLSAWQGDVAAGLYGGAYRLWEALGLIPSSFLDALFPELSQAAGRDRGSEKLRDLYRRGRRLLWLVVPLVIVPSVVGARMMIGILYGSGAGMSSSVPLFRLLLLAFPFTYLYLLNGHALYAVGQQRRVTAIIAVATVINAVCNALVIPLWSYWGAVGVSLASEFLLFVLLEREVRRLFPGQDRRIDTLKVDAS